jgi:o-succinylbenzoate---CoA ligase
MFQTDIAKQTILIDGKVYTQEALKHITKDCTIGLSGFNFEVFHFLHEWFDASEWITIQTSGSTGEPKSLLVKKTQMIQSACITCTYFGFQTKDKILLCMPLCYIAGKMMVVRALIAGLDLCLVNPTGNPLKKTNETYRFAAMVPLQVYNSLQNSEEKQRLYQIGALLIGGDTIDPEMENSLKDFPNPVYASYGMTETLSHIALRRINGPMTSLNFMPFPSVSISLSPENTLIIDAPLVCDKILYTNDIAKIFSDGSFRILGRKDNVIITGGLKVQIESVEAVLKKFIKTPFAISSLPDKKFGEIIVLAVEQPIEESLLSRVLPTFQKPKKIIRIDAIPRTKSGKINRDALKQILRG